MNRLRTVLPLLLLLTVTRSSLAAPTRVHEDATSAAFLSGRTDGVVVSQAGRLRPGARLRSVSTSENGVWALALGGDGVLYAGTGNEGRILGVRGDDVTVVHETGSVLVAAMVRGPDGEVYAGTVPDGRVYRVERMASGIRVSLLAELPDPNVWALDVDALGRVFAGTGPNGRVYRIAADGRAEVVLETGDRDVLSVLVDGRGGLLVGTGGKGLVLHVTPARDGEAVRVLHDFEEQEVRALARVGDVLYAAVNQDLGGGQVQVARDLVQAAAAEAARAGRGGPVPAEEEVGKEGDDAGSPKALLRGSLHALDLEGGAEKVLAFPDNGIAALAVDAAGGLILAAGRGGRVFRYTPDGGAALIHDLEAGHAGALAMADGRLVAIGAANAGSVHPVVEDAEKLATFTSRVVDGGHVCRWGTFHVETQVKALVVETRSGNTKETDATWSEWTTLRAPDPDRGEPEEGALRIASSAGRFLQYRLRWPTGATGAVRRVAFAYRPRNRRARLSPLVVNGTPAAAKEGEEKPKPETPAQVGPERKITWKVEAVDDDPLETKVAYRGIGEETWRPLAVNEKTLSETTYTWDTTSVPDGIYVVRVTVSDAPANANGALETSAVTDPFLVDNRRPAVGLESWVAKGEGGGELRGTARDGFSRIASLEFAVDGGRWRPLASTDGLLDEPLEAFVVRVADGLAKGEHSIAVRARDEAGNVGVESMVVRVE